MTEKISEITSIDPERLFEAERTDTERRAYTHESTDYCEAAAAGRTIVGVTDEEGRVLLLVNPGENHAILPNETVAPGESWATVGRNRVEELAGIDVALDSVERVRRVEHVVEGESTARTTHHVVFGATVASAEMSLDGLCDDDWTVGWHDDLPVETDEDEAGVLDDIRLFLD